MYTYEDRNILNVSKYLSEKKDQIFEFINENHRTLISANPASGKTSFFAELCINHKINQLKGKIVFCCPFLIIQEQFKEHLESKGIQINYELNHKSLNRKLGEYDKIVTSTFHSFKKIAEYLDENDTVIVDEAHVLLNRYKSYEDNTYTYFTDFHKSLYKSKAKIVLLTGTPRTALKYILDLKELTVLRKETPSRLNIQYTNENDSNIVLEFAKNSLNQFSSLYLNIIYVKNKKKCWLFKELIETSLNVKAVVLTSDEKDSEAYLNLVKYSQIPEGYPFLITTNVISTGTNILNKYIGKALMLDEADPIEIKQFCKRFRNKPDIEVDIINPLYKEPCINLVEEREYWIEQRHELRGVYQQLLNKLKNIQSKQEEYSLIESIHYSNIDSSPDQMINLTLEQFLIHEIYLSNQLNFTFNSNDELVNALNKFDDIMSTQVNSYSETSLVNKEIEETISTSQNAKLDELFDSFFYSATEFLKSSHIYLTNSANIYLKYKLENTINLINIVYSPKREIEKVTNNLYFTNNILIPFLEYYPYFKNNEKTIYFLKKTSKNKRAPIKISIFFNNLLHQFFRVEIISRTTGLTTLKLMQKATPSNPTDKLSVQFIKHTFSYLVSNDYVNYDDFTEFLLAKNIKLPDQLRTPLDFPYSYIKFNTKNRMISELRKHFIIGLVRSIFKLSQKQLYRFDKNQERKAAYMFITKAKDIGNSNIFKGANLLSEQENSITYEYSDITKKHDAFNINTSKRVLTNTYGLTNNILGEDFYEMQNDILSKFFQ